ncbi:MAG: PIG-L family deacetylase [Alphaproteobacteria bacterium]|nr:PIG-L family deacetylase [Alphaproteobacteria bacterium]
MHIAPPAEPRLTQILEASRDASEQEAIRRLLGLWKDKPLPAPERATPDGFRYVAHVRPEHTPMGDALPGDTLFLSPHPSDVSGDFFPLLIHHLHALGMPCRQLLVTRGEKGNAPMPEHETINLRAEEEAQAAQITGINVEYLSTDASAHDLHDDAHHFRDGELLQQLPELTQRLKEYIRREKPRRLALPALYPDHPDHVATAIAALNAVIELRDEKFFEDTQHGPIEIFTSDPEFALAAGVPWAVQEVVDSRVHVPRYQYAVDKTTGLVNPVADITAENDPDAFAFEGAFAVPPLLVTASEAIESEKIKALLMHRSQTGCDEKPYLELLPVVDGVRGKQAGSDWATALYPINIPGVTARRFSLADLLPQENVFQLKLLNEANAPQQVER